MMNVPAPTLLAGGSVMLYEPVVPTPMSMIGVARFEFGAVSRGHASARFPVSVIGLYAASAGAMSAPVKMF